MFICIVPPNITLINDLEPVSVENSSVTFECTATGIPAPTITWYRDNAIFDQENDSRVIINSTTTEDGLLYQVVETLTINETKDNDSKSYSCQASNAAGNDTAVFELVVQGTCICPLLFLK